MTTLLRALWVFGVVLATASECLAGGTLLVKYTEAVDASAETTFSRGRSFSSVSPGNSLDELNARLDVTEIRSLFVNRAGLNAREAKALWRARMEKALDRDPDRAARAGWRLPDGIPDLSRVYRLRYAADLPEEEAAALYAADPLVEYAHPDYPQHLEYVPDDPYFFSVGSWPSYYPNLDDLWNLKLIGAPAAWDLTMGEGVVIAVVDTGVDRDHPDIADNIWSNPGEIAGNGIDDDGNGFIDDTWGWDFVGGDNKPLDSHGHGTHVAGIAAAVGDNALGVIGVAPRAKIMSVRIFSSADEGTGGAQAIVYAAESGADVINNSWGGYGVSGAGSALDDAVDTALALGSVVVFAGSNGGLTLSPAPWWRHPDAINVSRAYPPSGTYAFSGSDVDIAAPGMEVLSLRGGNGMNGPTVGTDYVVGSGTSMATPHVSGAAALLLSVFPGISPLEVKWHLEQAAVPISKSGWEGIPWNPTSGWGLLDLTHAFDPLATTTRLDRLTSIERHEFVDQVSAPISVGHTFTSLGPVDWSTAAPAWAQAVPASGVGDGTVDLSIDAGVAGVGLHSGDYQLSAPTASDGGATLPLRLYAYPNLGLADTTTVFSEDRVGVSLNFGITGLAAAASPTHSVVAWSSLQDVETRSVVLDRTGSVLGSFGLSSGLYGQYVDTAFDGRHFAVVWIEYQGNKRRLLLSRLASDGTPLDAAPRELLASRSWWMEPKIAFDGRRYVMVWDQVSSRDSGRTSRLMTLAMATDFASPRKPRKVYRGDIGGSYRNAGKVELACGQGHCLAVWRDRDLAQTGIEPIRALRFVDGEPVDEPFDIAAEPGSFEPLVASNGDDYLVLVGARTAAPCGPTRETGCIKGVLGVRVSATGQVLDPTPVELITAPADTPMGIELGAIGFDGEQYVLPYALSSGWAYHCDSAVFVARVSVDGTVLDQGNPLHSMLVDPSRERQALTPLVAAGADGVTVAWNGLPRDFVSGLTTSLSIDARPMDSHSGELLQPVAIGSIGPIVLAEGEQLVTRLVAPGLVPAQTAFTAEGLPSGAVLDSSSGVLHWTPAPNEAGTYSGIRLMADDGSQHLEEIVTITVTNTVSSLSGVVQKADSTPVGGVTVLLKGRRFKRETMTEPDGSFAFFDLVAQKYRLALGRAAKKNWRASSQRVLLAGPTDDLTGLEIVAAPR